VFGIALVVLMVLFFPAVKADTYMDYQFLQPLGDEQSWSFEGDGYWSNNSGGYRSADYYIYGSHSWYASGGGDYLMWRDYQGYIQAIQNRKVMFSFYFRPERAIENGGFENGVSPWVTGGTGDHYRDGGSIHSGLYSMQIGYKYASNVANSRDYVYQTITVPAGVKNWKFSFWYHMFTEDYEPYNWFEVYVRDSSGNNLERIFYKAGAGRG
jgi:hypothetical protein